MSTKREELLAQILEDEARLGALDHERDEARARAWFFFTAPVAADVARQMG
jgi:hypothetical protein